MQTKLKIVMRDWLEKKSVKAALVVALIVVWGYNSYSIVGITGEDETADSTENAFTVDINKLEVPDTKSFTYKADFRDPFKPRMATTVEEKSETEQQQPEKKPIRIPNLKLTGIIEKMALIQNQNQQLFFVSLGDTVEGARVRFVTEDSVGLVIKEKKFNLKFNN